jgi:hypothetical protein
MEFAISVHKSYTGVKLKRRYKMRNTHKKMLTFQGYVTPGASKDVLLRRFNVVVKKANKKLLLLRYNVGVPIFYKYYEDGMTVLEFGHISLGFKRILLLFVLWIPFILPGLIYSLMLYSRARSIVKDARSILVAENSNLPRVSVTEIEFYGGKIRKHKTSSFSKFVMDTVIGATILYVLYQIIILVMASDITYYVK